jgi:NAD(P)-dependent dehydrogenase (short-subunit alcohol dehydrogenase family)
VRTDVTSLGDMQALTQAAFDAFGTVEILCNNAGVAVRPPRAIWDTSYADLKYMVDVNIWGLLHGYHVFIPRMRAQPGEKHIINTASMAAILSFPSQAIYTLTKSGMDGFSRVTDLELQADGFVTTVPYPGVVNTSAAQRSAEHRPPEDRQADAAVRPYVSYAAERGEPVFEIGAGRGAADVAKGGEPALRPIEPEVVGAMVVDAIRNNRRTCLTHPVAAEVFQERISAWMDGLKP